MPTQVGLLPPEGSPEAGSRCSVSGALNRPVYGSSAQHGVRMPEKYLKNPDGRALVRRSPPSGRSRAPFPGPASASPRLIARAVGPARWAAGGRAWGLQRRAAAFVAALVVSLAPVAVSAAPSASDVKKAAEAFDRGREAYRAESYAEAAEHFEAADDNAASAASLRLAIAARKSAGELDRALTLAALALSTYPDDADVQAEAQAVLDAHQADFGRIEVTCGEPCELTLDAKLVHGPRATEHVVYVEPGSHQVQASWSDDRSDGRRITALGGEARAVELSAPALTEAPAQPEDTSWYAEEEATAPVESEPKGWSPAVFWTGFGLTAAGIAVTTGLGVRAINSPGQQAVIDNCKTPPFESCDVYQQGVANQTAANIAGGVTAAVGVFTIVTGIWLTNWSGKKKKEAGQTAGLWSLRAGDVRFRPTVSLGDGATLGAVGTF